MPSRLPTRIHAGASNASNTFKIVLRCLPSRLVLQVPVKASKDIMNRSRADWPSVRMLQRFSSLARSPFLLFVRLYWGLQFMQTGWGKLHNLAHVAQFFASLGIPAPGANAVFVGCVEFFGGVLLMGGWLRG